NLTYTNIVTGYYTALYPKSYYDDPARDCGSVGREIVGEALNWLEDQGFDFTQISVDGNNRMLAINVFYAGTANAGWSNGLWPHKWSYTGFTSSSGVRSYNYQITSMGTSLVLRTFCHENGHMICGWPDLYDYGYESNGAGNYCLMAYGGSNSNPVPPNAYFRDLKGWDAVTDITNDAPGSSHAHQANSNTCFIYRNQANSNESFYIESRLRSGRNSSLPDEGLLIWHVDEAGSNDNEQMTPSLHYKVSVEQADGAFHLENDFNYGSSGDLFHSGYKDSFTDSTTPDAKWWDGSDSGLEVVNIGPLGATMSFWVNTQQFPPTAYDDSYNMVADETGTDSFTYVANDGTDSSGPATVTIEVGVTVTYQDYAQSETTVRGRVTGGTLGSTNALDGYFEVIMETFSGKNPKVQRSGLEHVWVFDVMGGDKVTFYVQAQGQIAGGSPDEFEFTYSTDSASYTTMMVTSGGVLTDTDYLLPSGMSGTVYIRVEDTDRSKGEITEDSIAVDYLCIESEATGLPDEETPIPNPMTWAVVPYAMDSTSILMTATTATDVSGVEYYFTCTGGGGHDSGWQSSATYEDTQLTPGETYTYTVKARDRSSNHNETAASGLASATTFASGSEAYIDSTVVTSIKTGRNYKGQAVVKVLDGPGGAVLANRTVTGNWYFPDETTVVESGVNAVTDASGTAVFISAPKKANSASKFTFVVVSVDGYDSVAGNVSGYVDVP
ncbi:MAG: M6 family metalloprotease domain-containing protein, partial [Planctomycetota bacterium]